MTLGLVCDACDALSPINATVGQRGGPSLGVSQKRKDASADTGPKPVAEPFGGGTAAGAGKPCFFCGAPIAPGHRFCGNCGKPVSTGSAPSAPAPAATPARP